MLAEQDRDAYRRNQAAIAREKEIMKDVEGWEVSLIFCSIGQSSLRRMSLTEQVGKSAYNTKRYTPTTIVVL
jgi:NADH dehydrogenase (ubiquinone) 1 alpha subcomplex subunit 13